MLLQHDAAFVGLRNAGVNYGNELQCGRVRGNDSRESRKMRFEIVKNLVTLLELVEIGTCKHITSAAIVTRSDFIMSK